MAAGATTRGGRGFSGRIVGVFALVALLYLALAGRLVYLQMVQHEHFRKVAEELRGRTRILPARRGVLLDRAGTLLVRNEPAADIVVDPNLWYARDAKPVPGDTPEARRDAALRGLARCLPDLDVAGLALKLSERLPNGEFRRVDVGRRVDAEIGRKISDANLPGVGVQPTTRRVAMNGTLAAHVLGYTDIDGKGSEGLEKALDETLAGTPGLLEAEFDPQMRAIPGTVQRQVAPSDGRDVILTLDAGLQNDVQEALGNAYRKYRAEAATAVVLDPETGDILALANFPTYDINRRGDFPAAHRANRAVTAPYEPGSTLKVVTMAAALEEGKVSPTTRFHCAGSRRIGRRTIGCAHGSAHGA